MWRKAEKTLIDLPTENGHASTIALVGGDVLMAWFGGTREGEGDVDIYGARRVNGRWETPRRLAGEDGLPHWNPVLFAGGEKVDLFYKAGHTIPGWHTRRMRSQDGGRTWTTPAELVPGDVGGRGPVRNKPIRLRSGRILAPASIETPDTWNAFVDISDDGGESFRASSFVPLWRAGGEKPDSPGPVPMEIRGKGVIQPTLWQSADDAVHMLLRSTEGFILRSDSFDGGESWLPAYSTGLSNNNSGIDLTRTSDGRLFLVMNPVSGNWAARTPLSLLVSTDGGATFRPVLNLEMNPGEYSYPAILSRGDTLYISYTWRRLKMAFWDIELEKWDGGKERGK